VREAANIVASAFVSAVGTLVHAPLLPSTPDAVDGPAEAVVQHAPPRGVRTFVASGFVSHGGPPFRGCLVFALEADARDAVLRRLGVG